MPDIFKGRRRAEKFLGISELALAVFLATAAAGVWAAYDRDAAWVKFGLIAAAILLYGIAARAPGGLLEPIAGLLALVGAGLALNFLFTYDWRAAPADLDWLNRVGVWWMGVRPSFPGPILPANTTAGLLAMLIPLPAALSWQRLRSPAALAPAAGLVLMAGGLLMTSSRGAWLALGGAGLVAAAGGALARWLGRREANQLSLRYRPILVLAPFLLLALAFLVLVLAFPAGMLALADRLPGLPSGTSRLELASSTLDLIQDFPIIGGGLSSFPGLYSRYIRVIPALLFTYSHNFYLDVALEQGILGGLALASIYLSSLWRLAASQGGRLLEASMLPGAVFVGILAVLFHGLIDDPLYGNLIKNNLGILLLFVLPGMAVAASSLDRKDASGGRLGPEAGLYSVAVKRQKGGGLDGVHLSELRARAVFLTLLVLILGAALLAWGRPGLAVFYANLGAVQAAQADLAGWSLEWKPGRSAADTAGTILDAAAAGPAGENFERSLRWQPGNRTAHHRLGLMALSQHDFPAAVAHLKLAYQADPGHRGIRKVLGYAYLWSGKPEQARPVFTGLPEMRSELRYYAWWWRKQGQGHLAIETERLLALLQ